MRARGTRQVVTLVTPSEEWKAAEYVPQAECLPGECRSGAGPGRSGAGVLLRPGGRYPARTEVWLKSDRVFPFPKKLVAA